MCIKLAKTSSKSSKGSAGGNWVTINGVHVLIGANGKIAKGPAKFIGSTLNDLPGSSVKSVAERKADLQKKKSASTSSTSKTSTSQDGAVRVGSGTIGGIRRRSRRSTIMRGTPEAVIASANKASSTKTATKSVELGFDTDYSKLTKKQIEAGMDKLEAEMRKSKDPFMKEAMDGVLFEAANALAGGKYAKSSGAPPSTIPASPNRRSTPASITDGLTTSQKKVFFDAVKRGVNVGDAVAVAKQTRNPKTTSKPNSSISVAGLTKSQNSKVNKLVQSGVSVDEAVDVVLSSAGYGLGTRKGMFR